MTTQPETSTRRDFLKTSTAAGTAALLGALPGVHAAGNETLKVGLIGCGGRGNGAADNCLHSSSNLIFHALGDAFEDRLKGCRQRLIDVGKSDEMQKRNNKVDLPEDRCFVGLDAYQKVIDSGVDLVLLATPPGFRPQHIQYAVEKGKHIFAEKPVGVDGPGIRKVLAAYEEAKKKNLGIAAGTQRRHQTGYLEMMKRIHDGEIGEITGGRCFWNQGGIWVNPRRQGQTDLEYQMRNWYYFVWLCGDHICEQHVHNLDVCNWALQSHPIRALGVGGRQVRTAPEYGHIYDHFAIDLEYPNGAHILSMCKQWPDTKGDVWEALTGTKAFCQTKAGYIFQRPKKDADGRPSGMEQLWRFPGKDNAPYVQEHTDLIESIRAGKPINELKNVAESTLTAIMGRMAAYTGQEVTWDKALNSQDDTFPAKLAWDMSLPVPPVAIPGKTKLV
jgi:predicted dehydrogenase